MGDYLKGASLKQALALYASISLGWENLLDTKHSSLLRPFANYNENEVAFEYWNLEPIL